MQSYDDKIRELLQQTDFTHVPYIDTGAPQRSWRQIVILVDGVDLPSDPLHSDPNRSLAAPPSAGPPGASGAAIVDDIAVATFGEEVYQAAPPSAGPPGASGATNPTSCIIHQC